MSRALTVDSGLPGRVVGAGNGHADGWQVWSGGSTLVEELVDSGDVVGVGRVDTLGMGQSCYEVAQLWSLRGGFWR